ncbi:hypothetical protein ScPMuIL_010525 [Solemya velum]
MATLYRCITGPKLFRIHKTENRQGRLHQNNIVEVGADKVLNTIKFCFSLSTWLSPILAGILYKRGYFCHEGLITLSKYAISVGVVYSLAYITRGVGRWYSPDYITFINVLLASNSAQKTVAEQSRKLLKAYDFEFWAWPVDFRWADVNSGAKEKKMVEGARASRARNLPFSIPCNIINYLLVHTVGRRMLYPGSTSLLNYLLEATLIQNRGKLIEEKSAVRAKLRTEDGNDIDTLFVDRSKSSNQNGRTLVLCSEGNAGFCEIGCMVTPLEAGYSVLGWNHPGFGGSTGVPFPPSIQCGIDTVMQYAIHQLGFTPDNIILFAWSIGGYPNLWAAMNYPEIKSVILDATFDDIMPLAVSKMPEFLNGRIQSSVKQYLNLNNAELICRYPGPVLLIRRARDEIITTMGPMEPHSNRGNNLLLTLLNYRYPRIVNTSTIPLLEHWLAADQTGREVLWSSHEVDADLCQDLIQMYAEEHSCQFPMQFGEDYSSEELKKFALFLAYRHMEHFDSTHCNPLPVSFLHPPWFPIKK